MIRLGSGTTMEVGAKPIRILTDLKEASVPEPEPRPQQKATSGIRHGIPH